MKANLRIGMLLTIGLWGCGSSSSAPKTTTTPDAPVVLPDAAVAAADSKAAVDLPGASNADVTPTPDVFVAGASDTLASDAFIVVPADGSATPDALAGNDVTQASDAMQTSDVGSVADVSSVQPDSAPFPDASSVVTSTSTPDNSTDPTICSTVVLGDRVLSADQSYDIVMPDCLRLSGTVTLDGPLPAGALIGNGGVHAFKLIRDANGGVTDMISYAADLTAVDDTHFRYSIGLPADGYDLMYEFGVKASGTLASLATRIGQEHLAISSSLKHDVTLPAIDLATYTVTLTGTDALPSNGSSFGRFIEVILVNSSNTLMVTGIRPTGATSAPMWVPRETITPFFMVQMSPVPTAPYTSGSVNQFKLDPINPTGDFSLAQPEVVKISGTVSDPYQNLTPVLGVGGLGTSGVSHYQCVPLAPATYPDSILSYPEGSTSDFYTDSPSLAFYPRKGLTCVLYANYVIATGSKGATPTLAGENTYAYMMDPTAKSPNAITLTADITRNVVVPDLGPQVTVTGTVKDARGAAIPSARLNFNSRSLVTAAVADKTFVGSLDVSSGGTYTLHALPGTYAMWISLPTSTASAPSADGGVSANKDAAYALPDLGFSLPDFGSGGGDCTTLTACCPTLPTSYQTTCSVVASGNVAAACAGILSNMKAQNYCL